MAVSFNPAFSSSFRDQRIANENRMRETQLERDRGGDWSCTTDVQDSFSSSATQTTCAKESDTPLNTLRNIFFPRPNVNRSEHGRLTYPGGSDMWNSTTRVNNNSATFSRSDVRTWDTTLPAGPYGGAFGGGPINRPNQGSVHPPH